MSLRIDPLVSLTLWVTLAGIAGALLAVYGLSRPATVTRLRWRLLVSFMSAGMVLTLLVLLNPTWVTQAGPESGKPTLTVLVDASASMATADEPGGQSRCKTAVDIARQINDRLAEHFGVRVRTFDAMTESTSPGNLTAIEPAGRLTDLTNALKTSLKRDPPQGQALVLLSDGIHNAGRRDAVIESAQLLRAMPAPVYTRTIGNQTNVHDVSIEIPFPTQSAQVSQPVSITAIVRHRGFGPGQQANVSLVLDGQQIDRQQVELDSDQASEVRFRVDHDEVGLYCYELRVADLPEELTRHNNTASCVLRVVDQPTRVLLLEGKPYWDTKFLMRTLQSDRSIALDSIVRLTNDRLLRRTLDPAAVSTSEPRSQQAEIISEASSILADRDILNGFQIVVLGRQTGPFLTASALSNLRDWISRQGGSLVCFRGSPVTGASDQLDRLLPVCWSNVPESRSRIRLTENGRELHWFSVGDDRLGAESLSLLPALVTADRPERAKPVATILAAVVEAPGGEPTPAVSWMPYGLGRTVVLEGAGMWRWAFLPPEHQRHDHVYTALWHDLMRWLVSRNDLLPGRNMALRADKITFHTNESARATLVMRKEMPADHIASVELTGDTLDASRTVFPTPIGDEPGVFRVDFGKLPPGRYDARLSSEDEAEIAFEVRNVTDEYLDLAPRPDLMARLAETSGGAVIKDEPAAEIAKHFGDFLARSRQPGVTRETMWDRWWVFAGIMIVWTSAWILRRSGGLV